MCRTADENGSHARRTLAERGCSFSPRLTRVNRGEGAGGGEVDTDLSRKETRNDTACE